MLRLSIIGLGVLILLKELAGDARLHLKWAMAGLPLPNLTKGLRKIELESQRLGSDYGGWIVPDGLFDDKTVLLSCGVGEDISFDVEFARAFQSKIVFVDPTPRSLEYLDSFEEALKSGLSEFAFNSPEDGISLEGLVANKFSRVNKAVWDHKGSMTFYAPKRQDHVSFSLANLQDTSEDEAIEVEVDTVSGICSSLKIYPDAVKFDIEGVAAATIKTMLNDGIKPRVIMVELEELMKPSRQNKDVLIQLQNDLAENGYSLLARDRVFNFTFVRE